MSKAYGCRETLPKCGTIEGRLFWEWSHLEVLPYTESTKFHRSWGVPTNRKSQVRSAFHAMTVKRGEGAVCVNCRPFPSPHHLTLRISLGLRKAPWALRREHVAFLSLAPSTPTSQQNQSSQDLSWKQWPKFTDSEKFISKSSDFYDTLF
jgi:hypothetical protein